MASIGGVAAISNLGLAYCSSSKQCVFVATHQANMLKIQSYARISMGECPGSVIKKRSKIHGFRILKSVQLDVFITSDDEDEMSEGFFEAIEELERMAREPSDVLEEMNDKLSARELQLMLVYFAQEGRDSWCALEVFEWLKKENRVDKETMELMVSIMCTWVKKLIEAKNNVADVVDLLVDMDCVGLKTSFSMIEKVISLYWEAGDKDGTISFVEEVLRREISSQDGDKEGNKGGPAGYLAWKMMEEGSYRDAAKLVIHLRECGLKPEVYSYLIAMTAVVKELNEFAKALRKLKGYTKAGLVAELDAANVGLVENYQEDLLADGLRLSKWVIEEGGPSLNGVIHERLLAMYVCAGRGSEAEQQLWEMKLVGKEADADLYDIVLAMCASQKEANSIGRLLTRMEVTGSLRRKKTLSWLLRGYIKGGHFKNAAETVIKMLDLGLYPEFLDRAAVLQGLSRRIQQPGNVDTYITLCKRLSDANLIGPSLVYLHLRKHKLWVIKML
ncbi:pentatricopeptide repeat-containing protein At2g30100, chloroplastic [Sesamum indicum]|uniref:Pentatricopeptide repeat-containing protein At2g30100, chloroplastic n=1 Tax=Sesamum indicum TaxID=4182 RepID=A0A6I9T8T0_SESIN|nr:pentatricopeptide repeat-containing protein At2g30100, chloroplastic [Sesamum indicum]